MGLFATKKKIELPLPPPPFEPEKKEELPEPVPAAMPLYEKEEIPEITPEKYEKEELAEKIMPSEIKPIFIAADEYKKIINNANVLRSRLLAGEERMQRLAQIKQAEEKTFASWRAKLEDIEKKLAYVDDVIASAR